MYEYERSGYDIPTKRPSLEVAPNSLATSILQNRPDTGGVTPQARHWSQSSQLPHDGGVRGRQVVEAACTASSQTDVQ